ncbi:MAG: hypothetical protein IJH90_00340 [Mogibacterium sp.]|nr:hypothetical protein [Mogibacterium sp.]
MKKILSILSMIMILLLAVMSFTACSGGLGGDADKDTDADQTATEEVAEDIEEEAELVDDLVDLDEEYGDVSYEDEAEDGEIEKVKTDISKFVGTWEAKSAKAKYLYGNVDLTVNANGTWTADITGEQLGGKWYDKGDYLWLEDSNEIFSFGIAYNKSGNLIMMEQVDDEGVSSDDGEYINSVLTRK